VVTKAKDAGVNEKDIWLALPRAAGRDAAQLRVAPGAGEWALYPWGTLDGEFTRSPLIQHGLLEKSPNSIEIYIFYIDANIIYEW